MRQPYPVPPGFELKRSFQGHKNIINHIEWFKDSLTLISTSDDCSIRRWDVKSDTELQMIEELSKVKSAAIVPGGKRIISGLSDRMLRIWDLDSGRQEGGDMIGHTGWVNSVALLQDGKRAISASGDNTLKVWDITRELNKDNRPCIKTLNGHVGYVNSVIVLPHNIALSASTDKTVRFWDLDKYKEIRDPIKSNAPVYSLAFSPERCIIAIGSRSNVIKIFDCNTEKIFELYCASTSEVSSVSFSHGGQLLAAKCGGDIVHLWRCDNWKEVGSITNSNSDAKFTLFSHLAFHPKYPFLATLSNRDEDFRICVWEYDSNKILGGISSGKPISQLQNVDELTSISELEFEPKGDVHPSPSDWRDIIIYFLLIDRFDNGRSDIHPFVSADCSKGSHPDPQKYNLDSEQGKKFQGGNLRGVTRRLDYIKNLGCNAIWISPVFKNRKEKEDYHGYGIQDFLSVDPRFGNLEELKQLVREAHEKGIYVILDVIINHTGDNWAYLGGGGLNKKNMIWGDDSDDWPFRINCPYSFGYWRRLESATTFGKDDAVWPRELQNPHYYKRRGKIRDFEKAGREEIEQGDFCGYKKLDLDNPEVMDCLINIYKYWIAVTDVDGFRLDTAKHLGPGPTAQFCNAIKEYCRRIGKHNFLIFGEVSGSDENIRNFLCRNVQISGTEDCLFSLEAALDFPLSEALENVFKKGYDLSHLRVRYSLLEEYYRDRCSPGSHLVTFLDNHDHTERFIYGLESQELAMAALGYLITSPGIPSLYYGTEQGFDGHGDKDHYVRECMFGGNWGPFGTKEKHFFDERSELYQHIKSIIKIRMAQPALRYGRMRFREVSEDGISFEYPYTVNRIPLIVFSRLLDKDELLVAINLSSVEKKVWVEVEDGLYHSGGVMVSLLDEGLKLKVEKKSFRYCIELAIKPYKLLILKNAF